MTEQASFWPNAPACCLARSAQEHTFLIALLEQEALRAGRPVLRISDDNTCVPFNTTDECIHLLSYAEIQGLSPAEIASPRENTVILADSPNLDQERYLHSLAGFTLICIFRQDQVEADRLIRILASHHHVYTPQGWVNQPPEEARDILGGPARFHLILNSIPFLIAYLDRDIIYRFVNESFCQWFGRSRADIIGHSMRELVGETAFETAWPYVQLTLAGQRTSLINHIQHTDGTIHTVNVTYTPDRQSDGQVRGFIASVDDITHLKQVEEQLRKSEERYRTLVENQSEGVLIVDAGLCIEYANLAAEAVFNRPVDKIIGLKLDELLSQPQKQILIGQFESRKKDQHGSYELEYTATTGEKKLLMVTATPRFDSSGAFIGSFAMIRDITERKRIEEGLRYRSTHDALTGVYNRFFFDEELSRLEENHRQPISVLMLDLDRLKVINDTHGHFAGDEVLRRVARLLRACLRGEDLIARLGGDEFAVLLPDTRAAEMEHIILRMQRMVKISNQKHADLPVSISIGGATASPGKSLHKALEEADQQLYKAKRLKYSLNRQDE